MNEKLTASVHEGAQSSLEPGERVELVASALVGELQMSSVMGKAFAATVLTAGMLTVFSAPKKLFLALTDRRLLFLEANAVTGRATSQLVSQLPRTHVRAIALRPKRTMLVIPTLIVDLEVAGAEKGLRLTFPTPCRTEGEQFATALGRGSRS